MHIQYTKTYLLYAPPARMIQPSLPESLPSLKTVNNPNFAHWQADAILQVVHRFTLQSL
jgi:hypothetical protein